MRPWNDYKAYLTSRFGEPVYRIGVDAGFSCPNRENRRGGCSFCDGMGALASYQRTSESLFHSGCAFERCLEQAQVESLETQVRRGKEYLVRRFNAGLFAMYLQAFTNTYAPLPRLREIYDKCLELDDFTMFIVSTRPDCIDAPIAELLGEYGQRLETWVELGLQSGSDRILGLMNRGHGTEAFEKACKALDGQGLNLSCHVVLGYPTESRDEMLETARLVNQSPVKAVKIHNLNVCSGTSLYDQYMQGEISVASRKRHIMTCALFLQRLRKDIVIERLMCETPSQRLAAPRNFGDKAAFLRELEAYMNGNGMAQGDLCLM